MVYLHRLPLSPASVPPISVPMLPRCRWSSIAQQDNLARAPTSRERRVPKAQSVRRDRPGRKVHKAIKGVMGLPGAPVAQLGPAGPIGLTGPIGPVGATGATGSQGPQGPAGASGAAGAQGPAGPAGPAGANWRVQFSGRGAWLAGTAYPADAVVSENGSSYVTPNGCSPCTVDLSTTSRALGQCWRSREHRDRRVRRAHKDCKEIRWVLGVQGPAGPARLMGAMGLTSGTGATGAQGIQGIQGPAKDPVRWALRRPSRSAV